MSKKFFCIGTWKGLEKKEKKIERATIFDVILNVIKLLLKELGLNQ